MPSVPFLNPEFSNPLFLKITCQAILNMDMHEFPKGLNGFSEVFDFYLNSLENVISKKKNTMDRYIVHKAVDSFINALYPDNLWGIHYREAMEVINKCDSNSNSQISLIDALIFEGLLSLDIVESKESRKVEEVVRFTYERFNDYSMAQHILQPCNCIEDVRNLFESDGVISTLLKKENKYKYKGIIEALGIEIPERFGAEFIEFIQLDNDSWEYNWYVKTTFQKGILSRTGNSISDKSLELLNYLGNDTFYNPALSILISLSTEPNHPWNADFLNRNLKKRTLSECDSFWSTYIAINDFSEIEGDEQSALRTLLDWAQFGNLSGVDEERLRLTALILLWFTTTSNNLIRQHATKALSRVFYYHQQSMCILLDEFNDCNDPYLIASLYGAVYGAVVQVKEAKIVHDVCACVINNQFTNEKQNPHILIRDYARGIIEYTYSKFPKDIYNIELYRPPYKSKWPLENPLPSEIEAIDDQHSSIKDSVQGFISDFGKYIMKNAECWTATELDGQIPKSGKDFQYQFSDTLPVGLRERYHIFIDEEVEKEKNHCFDLSAFLDFDLSEDDEETDQEDTNSSQLLTNIESGDGIEEENALYSQYSDAVETELVVAINEILDEGAQEYFSWIREQGVSNRPAKFSQQWACRWVINRAYELGWTKEVFGQFEKLHCNDDYGQIRGFVERIGQKYQWIAYYELLARLSDNLIFVDRGYSDVDDSSFWGPWQIDIREIDPTFWFRAKKIINYGNIERLWWRPHLFNMEIEYDLEKQTKWLWDDTDIPDFKKIINPIRPNDKIDWLVLYSFSKWENGSIKEKDTLGEPTVWYRINSCVVRSKDINALKKNLQNKSLRSPDIIHIPNNNNQCFWGEYPWHPCYETIEEWKKKEEWERGLVSCEYHVPIFEYKWNTSSFSHMPDESTYLYMPSKKIITECALSRQIEAPASWCDENNREVFIDPSFDCDAPPCALFRKDIFQEWLRLNDFVLVWIIGGEKQLFNHNVNKFYGRLLYSGLYTMDSDGNISGEMWTEKELPRKR